MARYRDNQSWFDTMLACLNGHVITSMAKTHPENLKKRCPDCGAETITQCPKCKAEIQGYEHIPGVAHIGSSGPPAYCHECGEPYPWTKDKSASDAEKSSTTKRERSNNIFVVHGHDEEMKQAVARVISRLGLNPIILHEQPNQGRTLIEKFEQNADVQFAVILLSPDDLAYPRSAPTPAPKPRPRQNVVLELGYFAARLGRGGVCALKREGELELPTDVSGVAYTPYDAAGHWRLEMVRELKAAGYDVDANRLL